MEYVKDVKPIATAVTKMAELMASRETSPSGYRLLAPPLDVVVAAVLALVVVELGVLVLAGGDVGEVALMRMVEVIVVEVVFKIPDVVSEVLLVVVTDFPSALALKLSNVSLPDVGGLMAKTIPPSQCPGRSQKIHTVFVSCTFRVYVAPASFSSESKPPGFLVHGVLNVL